MSFEKIKKCLTSLKKNLERKREKHSYLEVNILDLNKNTMNGINLHILDKQGN